MGPDLQATIATSAFDLQFKQIVPGFPAGFDPVGMSGAGGDTHPIATHLYAVCVLVAEQMYSSNIVQKIPKCIALPQPSTGMVAHDEMLDATGAQELHASRIDEEIALLVGGAGYKC